MTRKLCNRFRSALLAMTALSATGMPIAAFAQTAGQAAADATYAFDVPAQPLARALNAIATQAGLQVIYPDQEPLTIQAPAVRGTMSASQALATVLSGSGYTFRYLRDGVITLVPLAESGAAGERVLGAVRVEGAQGASLPGATAVNGINGSRDVTATEGTGSYTTGAMTIGSKMSATIKEVPRAVSVLADQQIKDQNLTSITDAMKAMPGVIAQGETLGTPTFYSRGFQITAFQVDGGAPFMTKAKGAGLYSTNGDFIPNMDMSLYDHVELIRGAAGTFNGFGNPGGVVNLVRKKPLDHDQLLLDFQLGSFGLHRVSADVTGPLAFEGRLRGRLIATHQDNKFFYGIADSSKNIISGTLEYDLTSTTLVSMGATYDEQDFMPWQIGLMRDMQGNLISVSRSTCLCRPGARSDTRTWEAFGQIEQKVGEDWTVKYKATYAVQDRDAKGAYVAGVYNSDPAKNQVMASSWGWEQYKQRRLSQEVTVNGEFTLFGLSQKLVAGLNHSITQGFGAQFRGFGLRDYAKVDPLSYDPYAYNFDGSWYQYYDGDWRAKQVNAYVSADLQLVSKLHVLIGVSALKSSIKGEANYYCTPANDEYLEYYPNCSGGNYGALADFVVGGVIVDKGNPKYKGSGKIRLSWPPSTSLRFDVFDDLSLYATYADIRIEQASLLRSDGSPMDPVTGGNFEGGVKWSPNDGNFNLNLSGYHIRQKGFARYKCSPGDSCGYKGNDGTGSVNVTECCYITDTRTAISYGFDLEITGEVRRGWQISASYTFNKNINKNSSRDRVTGDYNPLLSYSPRHLYKFWTSYAFDEGSRFKGLSVYTGVQGQSETFISDSYCPQLPLDVAGNCTVSQIPVHYTSPGWFVVNIGGTYKLNPNLSFQLNIDNLLDKSYLATVGGLGSGSWYGSPRNIALTMHAKF